MEYFGISVVSEEKGKEVTAKKARDLLESFIGKVFDDSFQVFLDIENYFGIQIMIAVTSNDGHYWAASQQNEMISKIEISYFSGFSDGRIKAIELALEISKRLSWVAYDENNKLI